MSARDSGVGGCYCCGGACAVKATYYRRGYVIKFCLLCLVVAKVKPSVDVELLRLGGSI